MAKRTIPSRAQLFGFAEKIIWGICTRMRKMTSAADGVQQIRPLELANLVETSSARISVGKYFAHHDPPTKKTRVFPGLFVAL